MKPRELVQAWVEASNRADVDVLTSFYSSDATNHQVAESPVVGRAAIREMLQKGFANTKMVCIVENIFEEGQWTILEWRDPLGLRGTLVRAMKLSSPPWSFPSRGHALARR